MRGPQGAVIFTYVHTLGQMPTRGVMQPRASQALKSATLGTYTVDAVLTGAFTGTTANELARASTTYKVIASGQQGAVAGLNGTVTVRQPSVKAGEGQSRNDTLRNTSSVDFVDLKVVRVVVATSDGKEVQRLEQRVNLPSGGQLPLPQASIDTSALTRGVYSVLLLAEVNGQLTAIDQTSFVVTTDGVPIGVPTLSEAALVLLAVAMVFSASLSSRRRAEGRKP